MKLSLSFCCLFFLLACHVQEAKQEDNIVETSLHFAAILDTTIRDGDIILRSDDDLVGLTLRNMNDSDKTYSHSGFAFKENGEWMVYNMMAGEENPSLEMRKDSLWHYIDPEKKSGFAVYRYDLSDTEIAELHRLLTTQFNNRLLFDTSFNLADDSLMYCSELVAKNIHQISNNRIIIPTTHKENFSFKATSRGRSRQTNLTYIAPDNLYLNEHCRLIISKRYHP